MTATEAKGIGNLHSEWLEARGISVETAARFGVYTATLKYEDDLVIAVPNLKGNALVFPCVDRGSTASEKYRLPEKNFKQRLFGPRTFFNADAMDDPTVLKGAAPLLITEGEPDALAAIESGHPYTVSVPDGAPPQRNDDEKDRQWKPEDDKEGKYEFMFNNAARLKKVPRFVLAMDNDEPGRRMFNEIVMRLTPSRCSFVEYPEGCKDTNDVLMKHGKKAVLEMIDRAKPCPVRGLYRLSDYPPPPRFETYETGLPNLEGKFLPFPGAFIVVTGIPQMGKSTVVLNILAHFWINYGIRSAIFSPEMPTIPHMQNKMRAIFGGSPEEADAVIQEAFRFIDEQDDDDLTEDLTIDWIIQRAEDAVRRDNIKALLIDPWNEAEHFRGRGESLPEYISRTLRKLRQFGRRYGVMVFVCCHPTKDVFDGKKGTIRVPTLYDCDGGAMWFNKADLGACVHRPDPHINMTSFHVQKVKFEGTGERVHVNMKLDLISLRYTKMDVEAPPAQKQEMLALPSV